MKSKFSLNLLLCAMMGIAMVGCVEPLEEVKTALQSPSTTLASKSYNALTFSWEKVANAIQYGYVLTNPTGKIIDEGTTVKTSAPFSGLLPDTEYTLKVWAFPSLDSDYSTSPSITLTGATDPLKKVTAPQPEVTQDGTSVIINWEEVPEASSYTYILTGPGIAESEPVDTTDTEITFYGLQEGTFTFAIYTNCTTSGYETESQTTTISFDYIPPKDWRAMGTITYGYYNSGIETPGVISYDEKTDTYTIEGWCGVTGIDLSFKVTADGMEVVDTELESGYYSVPTGLETPRSVYICKNKAYTTFEGDMNSGDIWIAKYDDDWSNWDYINFHWDAETSHPTIDDICGSYLYSNSGLECYTDYYDWADFSYEDQPCTITKTDDNTVWISTILSYPGFEECGVYATYDPQTLTLTIPTQEYASWYKFGLENDDYTGATGPEDDVVAKIAGDGSIPIENWVIYYDWSGYWVHYFTYTESCWTPTSNVVAPDA